MNQTASASAGTQSGTALPIRTFTLWHALISAALCLITGVGLWWIYSKVLEQGHEARTTRAKTEKLHERQEVIESTQVETKNQVEQARSEVYGKLGSLIDTIAHVQKQHEENSQAMKGMQQHVQDLGSQLARGALEHTRAGFQPPQTHVSVYKIHEEFLAMQTEAVAFQQQLTQLMDSEQGKTVASVPGHVEFIAGIVARFDGLQEDFAEWKSRINVALEKVRSADRPISPDNAARLEHLSQAIRHEDELLKQEQLVLQHILREASKTDTEPSNTTPVGKTLREGVAQYNGQRATDLEQRLLAARRKAWEDAADSLDEAARRNEAARIALKEQKENNDTSQVLSEVQRLKQQEQARQRELETRLAKEQLIRQMRVERSKIDNLLRPFTSHGFSQPGPLGYMRKIADKRPVSLSRLRAEGALDNTIDGLTKLFCIGGGPTNERNKGGFPVAVRPRDLRDKPHILATVKEAQRLLNAYGPLLVDEQLLAD